MAKLKSAAKARANSVKVEAYSCVLCDDVRIEDNGKVILIGVYSGDIVVDEFPCDLLLRLFLGFRINGVGRCIIESEITCTPIGSDQFTSQTQGKMQFESHELNEHEAGFPTPAILCRAERSSIVTVSTRVEGGDWTRLLSKRIIVRGDSNRGATQN